MSGKVTHREGWRPPQPSQGRQRAPTSVKADMKEGQKPGLRNQCRAQEQRNWSWLSRPAAPRQQRRISCCLSSFLRFHCPHLSPLSLSWTHGFLFPTKQCSIRQRGRQAPGCSQRYSRPRCARAGLVGKERRAWHAKGHRGEVCCHPSHPSHRL